MVDEEIKLSYIQAQLRVRCEFTKAQCQKSKNPPSNLIERAKKKLESERSKGNIDFYRFFETRLNKVWELMRYSTEPGDASVAITLASGAPKLDGVRIESTVEKDVLGLITIDAPIEEIKTWKHFYLKLTVGKLLRDMGITDPPNPAQLKRYWFRARTGVGIKDLPLMKLPAIPDSETIGHKPYALLEEDSHRDISLVIYDFKDLGNSKVWNEMLGELHGLIERRNNKEGCSYELLYEDMVRSLRSALRGPERLGFDLPRVELVALDAKYLGDLAGKGKLPAHWGEAQSQGDSSSTKEKPIDIPPKEMPSLNLEVEEGAMTAHIAGTSPSISEKYYTLDWIKSELDRKKVSHAAYQKFLPKIEEQLNLKKSVIGMQIAEGVFPEVASDPYLKEVYRENFAKDTNTDLRDRQAKEFVNAGDLIARVVFRNPGGEGFNIYGETQIEEQVDVVSVECGDGIKNVADREFYAECDGKPKISGFSIELERMLLHKGDVNLASGNLRFDGSVEIKGAIDAGAVVEVGEDLTVTANIRGGTVIVGGELTVKGGINTAPDGKVFCRGKVSALFIENSEVEALGGLDIKKSILNSKVRSMGEIKADTISGGVISAYDGIECNTLGMDLGGPTVIFCGINTHADQQVRTRSKRLFDLKETASKKKQELQRIKRDLRRSESSELSAKAKSMLEQYTRVQELVTKAEEHLARAKSSQRYNKSCRVNVLGTMYSQTKFSLVKRTHLVQTNLDAIRVYYSEEEGIKVSAL